MAQQGTEFNSSAGRIVWGHPMKLTQRKDVYDNPIFNDDGTPAMGIAFGLAIPKPEFMANEWPQMQAEAAKGFPNGVPQNFSWKIKDGDTDRDSKGNLLSNKEGYAGCYILTIASNTGFPPSVYRWNGRAYDQLTENDVKAGDFVSVAINAQVNVPQKSTHTPSLYINPQAIEFIGYGTPLAVGGVDPMQAFGGRQHQLPPGASATPVSGAPAGVQMPGTGGGAPMGGGMPGQMPGNMPQTAAPGYPAQAPTGAPMQPQQTPGYPAQQGMPAPHTQFVQQPGAPMQQQPMQPGYPAQQPQQMPGQPPMGGMPGMPGPR